jgi:hypothetical protein
LKQLIKVSLLVLAIMQCTPVSSDSNPLNSVAGMWISDIDASSIRAIVSTGRALDDLLFLEVRSTGGDSIEWKIGHLQDTIALFLTDSVVLQTNGHDKFFGFMREEVVSSEVLSPERLMLCFPRTLIAASYGKLYDSMKFVSIGPSLTKYVNRQVLAGDYVDTISGLKFRFDESGAVTTIGGGASQYEIPLIRGSDYRAILKLNSAKGFFGESLTYGFRWRNGLLCVFGTSASSEFPDQFVVADSSIAILKPLRLVNPENNPPEVIPTASAEIWLLSAYVDVLRATKSPRKAFEAVNSNFPAVEIEVFKERDRWIWQPSNFHEGMEGLECAISEFPGTGDLKLVSTYGSHSVGALGRLIGDDTLEMTFSANPKSGMHKYVRIRPNLEAFVNNLLLSGHYLNQDSIECSFDGNGVANWGDEPFRYMVLLDCMGDIPDGFILPYRSDVFGFSPFYSFKWNDGKLYIYQGYNIHPSSEGATAYNEPLLVLTQVKR